MRLILLCCTFLCTLELRAMDLTLSRSVIVEKTFYIDSGFVGVCVNQNCTCFFTLDRSLSRNTYVLHSGIKFYFYGLGLAPKNGISFYGRELNSNLGLRNFSCIRLSNNIIKNANLNSIKILSGGLLF